ncbi:hypothetical protein HMPREF0208_01786 [Citrobacter koseri]|nr:hypothetical protein HMPREF3207_03083 [Citrobacter koseri]KXB44439.1 hypothetical protein HMPREF0208_01786 [Citrobacter koseri]
MLHQYCQIRSPVKFAANPAKRSRYSPVIKRKARGLLPIAKRKCSPTLNCPVLEKSEEDDGEKHTR